jgi:hypothetical protein
VVDVGGKKTVVLVSAVNVGLLADVVQNAIVDIIVLVNVI